MSNDQNNIPEDEEPKVSGGVGSLLSYNRKLRDMLEEVKASHRTELRELKRQIRDLEGQNEELGQASSLIEQKVAQAKSQWERERAALKAELEALKTSQSSQTKSLEERVRAISVERDTLDKNLKKAESRLESLDKLKHTLLEKVRDFRIELTEVKSKAAEVETERDKLIQEKKSFSGYQNRIESLEVENFKQQAELEKQAREVEAARKYNQEAESREAENASLKALAAQKEKEAATSLRLRQEAEALAFESRAKLLELYTQEESKEMTRANLEETRESLAAAEARILELTNDLVAAEKRYEEMEEKLLYSSERESLRASLAARARKRNASLETEL